MAAFSGLPVSKTGLRNLQARSLVPVLLALAVLSFDARAQRADLTELLQATRASNHEAAIALIESGADVRAAENDGTTALHWAAYAGDADLVAALLEAGADANAANRYGMTPLQAAAEGGFAESVSALLEAGAEANVVLPEGETILMTAARSGNAAVLEALLAHDVDTEARDGWYGETALIAAAAEDHADAVRVLVRHGAGIDGRSAPMTYQSRRLGQSILPLGWAHDFSNGWDGVWSQRGTL